MNGFAYGHCIDDNSGDLVAGSIVTLSRGQGQVGRYLLQNLCIKENLENNFGDYPITDITFLPVVGFNLDGFYVDSNLSINFLKTTANNRTDISIFKLLFISFKGTITLNNKHYHTLLFSQMSSLNENSVSKNKETKKMWQFKVPFLPYQPEFATC